MSKIKLTDVKMLVDAERKLMKNRIHTMYYGKSIHELIADSMDSFIMGMYIPPAVDDPSTLTRKELINSCIDLQVLLNEALNDLATARAHGDNLAKGIDITELKHKAEIKGLALGLMLEAGDIKLEDL